MNHWWFAAPAAWSAALLLGGCAAATAVGRGTDSGNGEYAAYVVSESVDRVARVVYGPDGARVDRVRDVSTRPTETEGPHGVAVSPDGRFYYVTLGHGTPFGSLWKLSTENDEVLGRVTLGLFPATVDVTPDGEYGFVSNFNLHGDPVPSSISKVHLPTMAEVARTETCVMPHGSRVNAQGTRHYSVCMMDELLVEIDVATGEVARRFSVAPGHEGAVESAASGVGQTGTGHTDHSSTHVQDASPAQPDRCSPTWAHPSPDGAFVYVACNRRGEVLEIDVRSWTLSRRFSTGENPYNLDVTPDGRLLLVTLKNRTTPGVEILDLRSGRSLAHVPSSTTLTHGLAVTRDSRYAFVTSEGRGAEPGKVDVVDLRSFQRVGSVDVGQQAAGIAAAQ